MCHDRVGFAVGTTPPGFLAMPARIVLVHDEPEFSEGALAALRGAGYDAIAFMDSRAGIDALEHPKHIELLITRVRFPQGTPNGTALARMARLKRPGIKVLFASFPEVRQHIDGLGEFLPRPFSTDELLETVDRMLDRHD
jgi:DNA-binding NtrC family response regulator